MITTTADHPFYVKNAGFVNAGDLRVGDKLLDGNCDVLIIESAQREVTETPVKVYNFQVEEGIRIMRARTAYWCIMRVKNMDSRIHQSNKS